jgi:hypothetical protein
LGYLKKAVTCRILCAGKVTLGRSYTPPNNILLELGDVRSELGMPDRWRHIGGRVRSSERIVQSLMSIIQYTLLLQKLSMGCAHISVRINQSNQLGAQCQCRSTLAFGVEAVCKKKFHTTELQNLLPSDLKSASQVKVMQYVSFRALW